MRSYLEVIRDPIIKSNLQQTFFGGGSRQRLVSGDILGRNCVCGPEPRGMPRDGCSREWDR